MQNVIRTALAIALLVSAAGLMVRAYLRLVEHARVRDGRAAPLPQGPPRLDVRPLPLVTHRHPRRHRRRHDVGRLGLAHHHRADGPVSAT